MSFHLEDLRVLALILLPLSVLVVGMLALAWRRGADPRAFLTSAEWRVLYQIVAILVFTVLLLQGSITFDSDVEQFIYGRF